MFKWVSHELRAIIKNSMPKNVNNIFLKIEKFMLVIDSDNRGLK